MSTRREFLLSAAALLPACAAGRGATGGGAVPAIDVHTHFYDPRRPQGVPWPPPSDALLYGPHLPADFEAVAAPAGVVGTVVVEASPWVEDNQWLLDLAHDHPSIVGVVGRLAPGTPTFATHLDRFAADPLFRGLRFGAGVVAEGLGTAAFLRDVARLAERDLSLDLLGGPAMLPDAVRLARAAPSLRIVLDHLPFEAWDGDPEAARRALAPVAARPNVYAKVSGVVRQRGGEPVTDLDAYRPGLDVLWEVFGVERVLYASNWPVSNRAAPYDLVHGIVAAYVAARGRAAAEQFFWRNARDVYRWVPRGAAAELSNSAG